MRANGCEVTERCATCAADTIHIVLVSDTHRTLQCSACGRGTLQVPDQLPLERQPISIQIEVLQGRLMGAVGYAHTFRASDDPVTVEACDRAIRYADMLSNAIRALAVRP